MTVNAGLVEALKAAWEYVQFAEQSYGVIPNAPTIINITAALRAAEEASREN